MGRPAGAEALQYSGGAVDHGLFCALQPVCGDAGDDPARDQHVDVACFFVYLYDGVGLSWSYGRVPGDDRAGVVLTMDTQTIIAVAVVLLAGVWAGKMLLVPFIASLRPAKSDRCVGGCGCGHEERNAEKPPK